MKKIISLFIMLLVAAAAFAATTAPPEFQVYLNGIRAQNNDTISSMPSIEVNIIGGAALDTNSIKMWVDTDEITSFTKTTVSSTECTISYRVLSPLTSGTHSISMIVTDINGLVGTLDATGLQVRTSDTVSLQGNPLNYPNPFDPSIGTSISYYLTRDANVNINVYDISGNLISKKTCVMGSNGGSAGYNEVFWDGKTNGGEFVGNGMYIYLVIADGSLIGKGKMTALR